MSPLPLETQFLGKDRFPTVFQRNVGHFLLSRFRSLENVSYQNLREQFPYGIQGFPQDFSTKGNRRIPVVKQSSEVPSSFSYGSGLPCNFCQHCVIRICFQFRGKDSWRPQKLSPEMLEALVCGKVWLYKTKDPEPCSDGEGMTSLHLFSTTSLLLLLFRVVGYLLVFLPDQCLLFYCLQVLSKSKSVASLKT